MKTLAEIVSNVNVKRRTPLTRTMSCPSALSKFSDSSNAIISFNNSRRPQTAFAHKQRNAKKNAAPILPAKRSCSETITENKDSIIDLDTRPLKTKRWEEKPPNTVRKRKGETKSQTPDTSDVEQPPPPPAASADHVGASERSRKRLSCSSTLDNSDIPKQRPKRAMKQQSAAIETWRLNTIKHKQKQAGVANNLLSNFVEYNDQLQSPITGNRRRKPSRLTANDNVGSDDGVPLCLMESDKPTKKETGLTDNTSLVSKSQPNSNSASSDVLSGKKLLFLRSFFVVCSTLSFVSRCLIWFGGRSNIIHSMAEHPTIWIFRFYVSTYHLVLLMVEIGLGIPVILPKGKTLSILTQRGFTQSFFGIIDLLLHSNDGNMSDHIAILQGIEGALMSARERRVQISYAIISVSSRGMILIGAIYCLLDICTMV